MKKLIYLFIFVMFVSCIEKKQNKIYFDGTIEYNYEYSDEELELMEIINNYRDSLGLNKLIVNDYISLKCESHNHYMIKTNNIQHDYFVNRADSIKIFLDTDNVGENIGYNYKSNEGVFNAWLKSEGHHKQIIGNYHIFGLSIRIDSKTKKKYYTNIFTKNKSWKN